jgi:glucosamine 6-phosphate synthetase-like amidotransferase/phosphosugar isomerase protein
LNFAMPSSPLSRRHEQEKNGAVFVSETDTEVVPHLCEYLWKKKGGNVSLGQLVRDLGRSGRDL